MKLLKGIIQFHSLARLGTSELRERFIFDHVTQTISEIKDCANVTINGWIDKKPKKIGKDLTFGTLRDTNGDKIQLVDGASLLKGLNVEDVVQIQGEVALKRSRDKRNAEYEIKLKKINVLNSTNDRPSQLLEKSLKTASYPQEYRYMQLRLPHQQELLEKRYQVNKTIRSLLDNNNFTEIETPILFKPTPEGAREFLVPTRYSNSQPFFYSLTQSPQQYKQLLMAGGIQRYFQFARCFRDEDLRKDRQPEFTQLDLEMAFASGSDVMDLVESVTKDIWNTFSKKSLHTLNFETQKLTAVKDTNISRLTYKDAMTMYGIDKPDLRAPSLKNIDLSEFHTRGYENVDFPVFEVLILRNAISSEQEYDHDFSFLTSPKNYNNRVPIGVPILNKGDQTMWYERFLSIATFENPHLVNKFLNLRQGDIIFGSTRESSNSIFENPTPLGRLRQLLLGNKKGQKLFYETTGDVITWVVDFPLFSPVLESQKRGTQYPIYLKNQLSSTHHPFTMVKLNDLDLLKDSPLKCLGQHYDLVLNGIELGGGSTRVHDAELQKFIFDKILKVPSSDKLFTHLLNAFQMGTPPHAGFAIGFDRLCAVLFSQESIRDVIAFPKSINGSDLVVKSPATVDEMDLSQYNLEYLKNTSPS
ncbi:hypothetical protein KAFR_0E00690 [Kazachstania africana CBS 2517]|uniref:Aminoacyl-transfer RNA synthetases class-II family profile domain-containing protein n=1 Tax=Kazachstania africana (strain ATCC 22294 / BCRC 22015 / CBS 2517 / CECT 1963 / NBRC 1671 / NRRL Y-8276) TaxID=1071382 RepID=H2AV23_KAZAF|nr:hypothetical protein KAFR_0E00690 [Kazachstania africana CBS 2517]CCF58223.1 hypothetical protein KAFR_0E00690 [Kazachstania africana CBS 2517]